MVSADLFTHFDNSHDNRQEPIRSAAELCWSRAMQSDRIQKKGQTAGMKTAWRKFPGRTSANIFCSSLRWATVEIGGFLITFGAVLFKTPSEQQLDSQTQAVDEERSAPCLFLLLLCLHLLTVSKFRPLHFFSAWKLDCWMINREIFAHEINIPPCFSDRAAEILIFGKITDKEENLSFYPLSLTLWGR